MHPIRCLVRAPVQVGQIVGPAVSFASANASASEAAGAIVINVVRTGDPSGTATVDYATSDIGPTNACNVISDHASSRCDYLVTTGTLTFAPGETSKPISVPIVDDSFAEGAAGETFNISLLERVRSSTRFTRRCNTHHQRQRCC